ncbi:sporulation protein YqfD [Paenibacillus sp. GP183]|jgi:similar to stage IV sporulation protein|uniref:sporulation protein YqfD n=1 Tax=Paenibacillus sp. GP183 TaxID=1882751 RepID=UPI000894BC31|nr:sporulation protein YqfD [Paenibacillus sp. GP183]SEB41086.1 similar to stage IV sporulation protein [Paenibacillus sp. GP183]
MQSTFFSWLSGYVRIELRGSGCEALLNELIVNRFQVWDIQVDSNNRMKLQISIRDFFRLRPICKRTGCRLHVQERRGLPFFMDKLAHRKFFISGAAGFIIGLYLLTSLVWQVSVEGNEKITTDTILQVASQQGIQRFQWKFRLPEADALSRNLQGHLPGTAWVGVNIRGTHITIKIVESTVPDKPPLMNPRNLIASKNALVTEIMAVKGRPVVKPNMYVRKGDLLISGIIGMEPNTQIVVATGTVKGLIWYTSNIEVPLVKTYKVYSGESYNRRYLVMGTRALQLTGYRKPSYAESETIPERKTLQWRSYSLPIGWLYEKVMEMHHVNQPISYEEAKSNGLEQAKLDLLSSLGKESRIVSEKILHQKTDNGKVYMEVLFEVEESIIEEQPIVIRGE